MFFLFLFACVCAQLAKVWLQLVQLKKEEGVDKKELVQLLQKMIELLSECFNKEEQDNETQQHVRFPQKRSILCFFYVQCIQILHFPSNLL